MPRSNPYDDVARALWPQTKGRERLMTFLHEESTKSPLILEALRYLARDPATNLEDVTILILTNLINDKKRLEDALLKLKTESGPYHIVR